MKSSHTKEKTKSQPEHNPEASNETYFHETWKPLQYLNIYRLSLTLLIVTLNATDLTPSPLGIHNPQMFQNICLIYLGISAANAFGINYRWPAFGIQVHLHVLSDIAAISLLSYTSGGVESGLSILLIASIAGASMLTTRRTAIYFAAIAAIAVLSEQVFSTLNDSHPVTGYTQAGLLGAAFFATALLAHTLASRLRESEALAEKRGIDLENMAQLTEYIIQRMQTGIMVVDSHHKIRLINESACHLLDLNNGDVTGKVGKLVPELATQLNNWWASSSYRSPIIRSSDTSPEVQPRFARLGKSLSSGTLIFLEDTASMSQQAQQLKLASLGRLTASIAHEVRNPLGAISHAGQLLAESSNLDTADGRMTEIIQEQSQRVNTIIENILQLSRRDPSYPEELLLLPWLTQFIDEFCNSNQITADTITMNFQTETLVVRIDTSQLHQVMWNLCQNGLHHGLANDNPQLDIKTGMLPDSNTPFLEVRDHGAGINDDTERQLFEPFFTTQTEGTGLGLYLSRELCESNRARLDFVPTPKQGACFRITFDDQRRQSVT